MRKRAIIAAAGAGATLAVAAGGVAVATGGDDGAASHQYTQQQADAAGVTVHRHAVIPPKGREKLSHRPTVFPARCG